VTASFEQLRVPPRERLQLSDDAASDTSAWPGDRKKAEDSLPGLREKLTRLQELFAADARRGLLVILQGMDTSGKDGVIRHVFEGVNPQGVRVSSFKRPTPEEYAHDFLWRIHRRTPSKGEIVIFNRSHYEDVLVARVHRLVPEKVWSTRFESINQFERELVEEGVSVLKFFLHISREEQRRRLRDRMQDPTKHWKLNAADFHERRYWNKYRAAYEEMLRRTSTSWAPWYLVPSNHKWLRNLVVSSVLVRELEAMKLRYPPAAVDLRSLRLR
jgi:PPK2 family polyphosphate:nucleotide phosphotransferase